MRTQSREINVFSISALDLFASALGGFMLLTIIFMPFSPNTGDSAVRVAEVQAELEGAESAADATREELEKTAEELEKSQAEADAASAEAEASKKALEGAREALAEAHARASEAEELRRRIAELEEALERPEVKFPPLDIVIAVDTTGSMGGPIAGLKVEITEFMELLQLLSPPVVMGIIDFKDRCHPVSVARSISLQPLDSASMDAMRRFASAMVAVSPACNLDLPEAVDTALDLAVAMNWRSEATAHLVVILADNPAYPDREAYVLRVASDFSARGDGNQVSAGFVLHANSGSPDFLRQLARAGGGSFMNAGSSMTATLLRAIAGL